MKVTRMTTGPSWTDTTVEIEEIDDLDVAIEELRAAKAKLERAQLAKDLAEERVLELLDGRGEKTHLSSLSNGWMATAVYGETVTYDEERLTRELSTKDWDAVTVRKIDRRLLEAHVMSGVVDAHLVAECATIKPRKPFIKLTEHRESQPEEPS